MTYRLVVWLHVLGAVVWIGGMIFFTAVVVPLARREPFRARGPELMDRAARRFRWLAWPAVTMLLVTGIANLWLRGGLGTNLATSEFWLSPYGFTLAAKLFLVVLLVELALWADYRQRPRFLAAWRSHPEAPRTFRLERRTTFVRWLLLALAITVTGLGVILARGWPG